MAVCVQCEFKQHDILEEDRPVFCCFSHRFHLQDLTYLFVAACSKLVQMWVKWSWLQSNNLVCLLMLVWNIMYNCEATVWRGDSGCAPFYIKGALCSFGEIHSFAVSKSTSSVSLQSLASAPTLHTHTNKYVKNKVLRTLCEARQVAGSATNRQSQIKISLFGHETKESLFRH